MLLSTACVVQTGVACVLVLNMLQTDSLVPFFCLSKAEGKSDEVGSSGDGEHQAYEASHNAHYGI